MLLCVDNLPHVIKIVQLVQSGHRTLKIMTSFHILETEINLHCATKFGFYLTENNMRSQYKDQISEYLRKSSDITHIKLFLISKLQPVKPMQEFYLC